MTKIKPYQLNESYRTEIVVTDNGYLRISQPGVSENSCIDLSPDQFEAILMASEMLLGDMKTLWTDFFEA
jgi:hypothetical protein